MIMKKRILIISNSPYKEDNCILQNTEYVYYNNSKQNLEEILANGNFDFVIPLSEEINYNGVSINVLKLLESYGLEHFTNNYLKSLIAKEKSVFLMNSNYGYPFEVVTSNDCNAIISSLKNSDFPILITTPDNKEYLSNNIDEYTAISEELINNQFSYFLIYKKYSFEKTITIAILGNKGNYCYISSFREQNENDILKQISLRLFTKYNLKDFAEFTYVKKGGNYYLININLHNIENCNFVKLIFNKFNVNYEQLIYLFTLILYSSKDQYQIYINELISFVPLEIILDILPVEVLLNGDFQINYNIVCNKLKNRLLLKDDSNRYEFINLIQNSFESVPEISNNSAYIGTVDFDYDQYLSEYECIPDVPQSQESVLKASLQILNGQIRWNSPLTFYNICPPTMMGTVAASTITNIYNPNGMIDKTSAGYHSMEKQIVRQLSTLLGIDDKKSAGIFTSGGKVCITYAMKCGLNRCQRDFESEKEPVVITSNANHFSIEDAAYQLGIKNCVRIPITDSQEIDYVEFENCIKNCMEKKIPIACIIVSGGNTMHSVVEDINKIHQIVYHYKEKYNLSYDPYIYYDLVVCWPWLFYKAYDFNTNNLSLDKNLIKKIKHTSDILLNSHLADGFGFDFHKGGFSPYITSLFITKNGDDLYRLNSLKGEIRNASCYYSFTNSRNTTGIISAWNVLQSVGILGFQSYIANMIKISQILCDIFSRSSISILGKQYTYGFAIILWLKSPILKEDTFSSITESNELLNENNKYIYEFTEYLKHNDKKIISMRYLPRYYYKNEKISVISLLPMTMNLDSENTPIIAQEIINLKDEFDMAYINGKEFGFSSAPENVPR